MIKENKYTVLKIKNLDFEIGFKNSNLPHEIGKIQFYLGVDIYSADNPIKLAIIKEVIECAIYELEPLGGTKAGTTEVSEDLNFSIYYYYLDNNQRRSIYRKLLDMITNLDKDKFISLLDKSRKWIYDINKINKKGNNFYYQIQEFILNSLYNNSSTILLYPYNELNKKDIYKFSDDELYDYYKDNIANHIGRIQIIDKDLDDEFFINYFKDIKFNEKGVSYIADKIRNENDLFTLPNIVILPEKLRDGSNTLAIPYIYTADSIKDEMMNIIITNLTNYLVSKNKFSGISNQFLKDSAFISEFNNGCFNRDYDYRYKYFDTLYFKVDTELIKKEYGHFKSFYKAFREYLRALNVSSKEYYTLLAKMRLNFLKEDNEQDSFIRINARNHLIPDYDYYYLLLDKNSPLHITYEEVRLRLNQILDNFENYILIINRVDIIKELLVDEVLHVDDMKKR